MFSEGSGRAAGIQSFLAGLGSSRCGLTTCGAMKLAAFFADN